MSGFCGVGSFDFGCFDGVSEGGRGASLMAGPDLSGVLGGSVPSARRRRRWSAVFLKNYVSADRSVGHESGNVRGLSGFTYEKGSEEL